jgi:hypothetical protein
MQPTNSAQALSQLQSAQGSAQDPNSILQAQNQALGVNNAQQTVTGLRGAINNSTKLLQQVAPSVMGRTGSSLVTNAQATRQIANEQAPISQQLSQQGSQYNQAQQDLTQLQGQAQQQASGIYQGQQDKLSYLQNLYNSLYGQEQDAAKQAEAKREFDAQLAASKAQAAAANKAFSLSGGGGSSSTSTQTKDPYAAVNKQNAANAIVGLLKGNNAGTVAKTIAAIGASARNGNLYDQYKLALLKQYQANSPYARLINQAISGPSVAKGIL